jgi:PAS domain S-box-containing protein
MKTERPAPLLLGDRSASSLLAGVAATVCGIELAIILALYYTNLHITPLEGRIISCFALTAIATPIIHLLLIKPYVLTKRRTRQQLEMELKQKEAALARLDLQKQILELHAAVSETDVQGNITYVNERFCATTKYTRDELIGANHRIVNSTLHPPEFWREMYETLHRGDIWRGEVCSRAEDGLLCWSQTTIAPAKDANGRLTGFVSAHTDITEMKEREKRLQDTQVMLQHAMATAEAGNRSKSEFLAMMSHEIRTPMNGFIGMMELLREERLTPVQRDLVSTAHDCADSLLDVINNILDYSKMEAGKVDLEHISFSPAQIVDNVKSMLSSRAAAKGLTLLVDLAPDMPSWIHGDPTRFRQVLINLVGNAIKFTASGSVRVSGSHHTQPDSCVKLLFEVRDTGIGISPFARAKLFNRFGQVDGTTTRRFGGTGLGLAICKQLVELMRGEIGFESKEGKGSRFWFTITTEVCEEPVEHDHMAVREHQGMLSRNLKILVADDNSVNQKFMKGLLGRRGHMLKFANDGVEAVDAAKSELYDIILMDVQMPRMDGLEATRLIRQIVGANGAVPIVALTANAMPGQREDYLAAGMNDYITKPVNPVNLFTAIARLCNSEHKPQDATHLYHPAEDARAKPAVATTPSVGLVEGSADLSFLLPLSAQDLSILDTDRLKEVSDYMDPESLVEVIEALPLEIRECLADMKSSIDANDLKAVQRGAHKLAGIASNFGATRLFQTARSVETNSALDVSQIRRALPLIQSTADETIRAMQLSLRPA